MQSRKNIQNALKAAYPHIRGTNIGALYGTMNGNQTRIRAVLNERSSTMTEKEKSNAIEAIAREKAANNASAAYQKSLNEALKSKLQRLETSYPGSTPHDRFLALQLADFTDVEKATYILGLHMQLSYLEGISDKDLNKKNLAELLELLDILRTTIEGVKRYENVSIILNSTPIGSTDKNTKRIVKQIGKLATAIDTKSNASKKDIAEKARFFAVGIQELYSPSSAAFSSSSSSAAAHPLFTSPLPPLPPPPSGSIKIRPTASSHRSAAAEYPSSRSGLSSSKAQEDMNARLAKAAGIESALTADKVLGKGYRNLASASSAAAEYVKSATSGLRESVNTFANQSGQLKASFSAATAPNPSLNLGPGGKAGNVEAVIARARAEEQLRLGSLFPKKGGKRSRRLKSKRSKKTRRHVRRV
jgi:hypothetical protein